jgi:hypothetical protein
MQLFSQDQLLLCCAASTSLSRAVAECLLPQLLRVAKREETLRVQLWGAGACALISAFRGPEAPDNAAVVIV